MRARESRNVRCSSHSCGQVGHVGARDRWAPEIDVDERAANRRGRGDRARATAPHRPVPARPVRRRESAEASARSSVAGLPPRTSALTSGASFPDAFSVASAASSSEACGTERRHPARQQQPQRLGRARGGGRAGGGQHGAAQLSPRLQRLGLRLPGLPGHSWTRPARQRLDQRFLVDRRPEVEPAHQLPVAIVERPGTDRLIAIERPPLLEDAVALVEPDRNADPAVGTLPPALAPGRLLGQLAALVEHLPRPVRFSGAMFGSLAQHPGRRPLRRALLGWVALDVSAGSPTGPSPPRRPASAGTVAGRGG